MRTILKCKRFSFVFDLCQLNRKILHYSLQLTPLFGSAGQGLKVSSSAYGLYCLKNQKGLRFDDR
jgi:hypothetical protein